MRFVRLNVDSAEYKHQELVDKARKKLKLLGYKVYDKEYDYGDFSVEDTNAFGGKSPDVIAKKNGQLVALEVKAKTKTDRLVEQLENYSRGGKVILLLELSNVDKIELWSLKELEGL